MFNIFKFFIISILSVFLFTSCSSKEEVILDHETQQKNSKEALKEL